MFYKQFTLQISPLPLYEIWEVITNSVQKLVDAKHKKIIGVFQNGICEGYFDRQTVYSVGNVIVEKIEKDPAWINLVVKQFDEKKDKMLQVLQKLNGTDLSKSTDEEIVGLFEEFRTTFHDMYAPAVIPFLCDFALEKKANEYLNEQYGEKMAVEIIGTLTAPTGLSWMKKEELELLKIVEKGQMRGAKTSKELLGYRDLADDIAQHVEEWAWIPFDYESTLMTKEDVLEKTDQFLRRPAIEQIKEIKAEQDKTEEKRQEMAKQLGNNAHIRMCMTLGELAYFKEYRKGYMSKSMYLVLPLLKEIAQRLHTEIKYVRYLFPGEAQEALNMPKEWATKLEERWKYLVYVQETSTYLSLVGTEGKDYLSTIKIEKPLENNVVRGTIACPGKATGTAAIVYTPKDLHKMKDGSILIAPATTPDLIVAIKKAAAIVTDTGGLTSHAAIVSREFNIPCVIGTTHATTIFKDGDKVEVDADKGIVRKI